MRRFPYTLLAAVVICGFGSGAFATDKPANLFFDRWTGFYVGINAGYGGNTHDIDMTASNSGTGGGGGAGTRRSVNTAAIPAYLTPDPHGFLGGIQLGYNWRLAPRWLVGMEADIDYAGVRGADTRTGTASGQPDDFVSVATDSGSQAIDWFGTLRPRLGFLATDNLLVYATGGLAFGHVSSSTNLTETTTCTAPLGCPVTNTGSGSASSTRVGWAAGFGTEWAVDPRWSLKVEYLYVDLGDLTYTNSPLTNGGSSVMNTTSVAHFNTQIIRMGLNYKIGSDPSPATDAMAAVPHDWAGFYAGINVGYGGDTNNIDLSAFDSGTAGGPGPAARRAANTGAIPTYLKTDPHGFVGGLQLGYNWQLAPRWLGGVEADFDFAGIRGSDTRSNTSATSPPSPFTAYATASDSQTINWFGTLRPRLGFLATNDLLVYATGGLAFGHVSSSTSLSETTCTVPLSCGPTTTGSGSAASLRVGWTAGLGTEWAVASRWSLKAEYLYVDLGNLTYANSPLTNGGGASILNTRSTAHFNTQIVRMGLNHQFD